MCSTIRQCEEHMFDQGHVKVIVQGQTHYCVRSISFEPLVGFTNNSAQISSMIRCAVHMFDQGRFKVKVIVQYQTLYDCILCLLYIFWAPGVIFKYLCTHVKYDESMCSEYLWSRSVQGQDHSSRLNIVWLYFVFALYLLNPWWIFQIIQHKCQVW